MKANPNLYDAGNIPSWDSSWHHNDFLQFIVTLTEHYVRLFSCHVCCLVHPANRS
jgi:hypothetical protein